MLNSTKYYHNFEKIGKGSFSTVYKGYNRETLEIVAIKQIDIDSNNKKLVNRLNIEIEIMKKLNHKNIIKLIDVYNDSDGCVYIIMEYCSNNNLTKFIKNRAMKEKHVLRIMKQIFAGLKYLISNNIAHRDLKPQNILLDENLNVKISDFGFAKIFKENNLTQSLCGSPLYMAPEIMKYKKYTIKADLWSLGIILFELLVGNPPYIAKTHIELMKKIDCDPIIIPSYCNISLEVQDLIYNLLQKNADNRISWDELFEHPWISRHNLINNTPINNLNLPTSQNTDKNIKDSFYNSRKFDRTGLTNKINHTISDPLNIPKINKIYDTTLSDNIECCRSPMFLSAPNQDELNKDGYIIVHR